MRKSRNKKAPRQSAFGRLLDAVQGRFRRARPGSVLILVVALLVLMALIGTAYITSAGADREPSATNVAPTEVELLVDGVKNLAVDQLVRQVAPVNPPVPGAPPV